MSPSYTRDYPLVAKRGHGAIVEDVDGNSFLDFAAASLCARRTLPSQGCFCDSEASRGADSHVRHGFLLREHAATAERLARTMPGAEDKRVFFTNSGTETVEGAIKLARYATKRDKMVAFYGCFHGRSMGALSLTASKSTQRKGFGALLSGIEHIPYPYAYRCAHGHTAETCGAEILEQLEGQIFKRLFDPRTSPASSSSPFRARAGMFQRRSSFCRNCSASAGSTASCSLWTKCRSGMGRTGKWWACEQAGVEPDILCSPRVSLAECRWVQSSRVRA